MDISQLWNVFLGDLYDIFAMMWDTTPDLWYFVTHSIGESIQYFGLDADPILGVLDTFPYSPIQMILGGAMFSVLFYCIRKFFSLLGA